MIVPVPFGGYEDCNLTSDEANSYPSRFAVDLSDVLASNGEVVPDNFSILEVESMALQIDVWLKDLL